MTTTALHNPAPAPARDTRAVTEARLERCLDGLAVAVADDPFYLPLFQRLEAELESLVARRHALERARARARR